MAEEAIIKQKLLLDGDGTGEDKRLQVFIKHLTKWVISEDYFQEREESFNKLLSQLHLFKQNRRRLDLATRCTTKQLKQFTMIQATFQDKIELVKKDITKHHNLLRRARVVRKNFVECELLVQAVNKQPCRMKLQKEIEVLKLEIMALESDRENLGAKLNVRVKQCHVLSTSANALRSILQEENFECEQAEETTML